MHFERSASYHAQVLADLIEVSTVLGRGPLRERTMKTIDAMAHVLVDLTHPDGYVTLMNDAGIDMAYHTDTILDALERIGRGAPRPRSHIAFEEAGYFGLRHDGDLFVVDCGPVGPDALPAHAHGDVLSFEWSLNGRRIIVDPGVFEYQAGPMRDYSRSTSAHNTVTVDGTDQAEFWGSFRCGRRPKVVVDHLELHDDQLRISGTHDGFAHTEGSPIHHRTLDAGPRRLRIQDSVSGGAGQPVSAALLFTPEGIATKTLRGVDVTIGPLTISVRSDGRMTIGESWYSPNIGTRVKAPRVTIEYGKAPVEGWIEITAS
jgi:uncharacterized heparinase superfamily protein